MPFFRSAGANFRPGRMRTKRRRRIRRTARGSLLAAVLALSSALRCDAARCPSICAFLDSGGFRGRPTPADILLHRNDNNLMLLAAPRPLLPFTLRRRSLAILMAKEDKSSDDGISADSSNSSKKGWFGLGGGSKEDDAKDDVLQGKQGDGGGNKPSQRKRGFFRSGDKDEDGDDKRVVAVVTASNSNTKRKRESKNKTSGDGKDTRDEDPSESSGGFLRWIVRSRGSSDNDDDDKAKGKPDNNKKKRQQKQKGADAKPESKKKLGLPSVDINAFVGPRLPDLGTELDVQAELGLSPQEVQRKEKARVAMELAKGRRLEVEERRQARIREAAERAEKRAEERRLAEQRKREILELQKAVREAAKTKPSSQETDRTGKDAGAPKSTEEEKSDRWPGISFAGGGKNKDKVSDDGDDKSRAKTNEKDGGSGGGVGGFLGGLSGIFGGGGNERDRPGEWIVVCPKTRIAPGVIVPVVAGGLDLLIVVSKDGKQLACISNSCPHLGTPLETGLIERRPVAGSADQKSDAADDGCEDCIVCPTHNTAFALASGEVRGEWCPYPPVIGSMMGAVKTQQNLPTFQIRARGKNIEVRLASSLDDGKDS